MDKMTIEELNEICKGSLIELLGIKFTAFDAESITGTIELNSAHLQPAGFVHGGVYISLAETLAGAGSSVLLQNESKLAFGTTVNSQHLDSVRGGKLTGIAKIIHKGSFKHIWDVKITNELGKLISISRVTNSIKELKPNDDQ